MQRVAIILALAVSAAGCLTTRAQTPIERPALDVPPVPARIIEPAPAPEVAGPEPELDPVPPLPEPPPTPRRPAATSAASAKEAPKPEAKPETPAADAAVAQSQTGSSVPLLRTPATANAAAVERQILDTLERAQKSLNSVDYGRLTAPRQKAYNEAKDFITGAEREVKVSNFELAKELANKAEQYATALLQGR